jgi:hypothetical protein
LSLTLTSQPPALVDMSALEGAILSTLAYSDIFDHPLTLDELHKFLTVPAERNEIEACASQMEEVSCKDGYYFLADRPEVIEIRKQREDDSRKAFRRAMFYGRIMGRLPFVRMVALTGSLAMLNLSKNNDMDYMLVAKPGRVWTARAFALLLGRLVRLFGDVICPNVIVSEKALEWDARNLYTAREFAQMIPVSGAEANHRLRIANLWVSDILLNFNMESGSYVPRSGMLPNGNKDLSIFQKLIEYILASKPGDLFEAWEMTRKIARFKQQAGYGVETNFSADICQGNFDHHASWTMQAYQERLTALEITRDRGP